MSGFDNKEVEKLWIKTIDKSGRTKYIHPEIVRAGGRRLSVFASDLRDDSGNLVLMGKYLIPLPDIEVKDGELLKVTKIWVTKSQARKVLRLSGTSYEQIFKSNLGGILIGFAAKAAESLLKISNVVLNPIQQLVADNLFKLLSDKAYKEVQKSTESGVDLLEVKLKEVVNKFAESIDPMVKEIAGDDLDIKSLVNSALSPTIDELRNLFDR